MTETIPIRLGLDPRGIARCGRADATVVEKSPIFAQTKCHTLQSNFLRNSLKTKESVPHEVTHNSRSLASRQSGQ